MGLLGGLILVETFLRVFFPQFGFAANGNLNAHALRVFAPTANRHLAFTHPDTGVEHGVAYNNQAMRYSRDITWQAVSTHRNVGIFGDSFTDNRHLETPYGYVELLDSLMYQHPGRSRPVNVLNFGVAGYGTDQSYLHYMGRCDQVPMEVVVYTFCSNDLPDISNNHLFEAGSDGDLKRLPVLHRSPVMAFLARWHLTYVFVKAHAVLKNKPGDGQDNWVRAMNRSMRSERNAAAEKPVSRALWEANPESIPRDEEEQAAYDQTVRVFQGILRTWEAEVNKRGARFVVVLLPTERSRAWRGLIAAECGVVDLSERFSAQIEDYRYEEHIRMKNDGHWNEYGNYLAALEIAPMLDTACGWPRRERAELVEAASCYFDALRPGNGPPEGGQYSDAACGESKKDVLRTRYSGGAQGEGPDQLPEK